MAQKNGDSFYIHGTSKEEQDRLSILNQLLNEACLEQMKLRGDERILDIGCGLGQFSRLMAKHVAPEGHVLGIERDEEQIDTAKTLAIRAGEEKLVQFRLGNALELPLKEEEWGSFDIVHARFVLEHISTPEIVIEQMKKAVRPGGRIIVSDDDHSFFRLTPEPPGFRIIWNAYMRTYDRKGNDPYIGTRLVSLLHQAGARYIQNSVVFFGGSADNPTFPFVAENLIGVVKSAKASIMQERLLDEFTFDQAMRGLEEWQKLPDAASWYVLCWAEGVK